MGIRILMTGATGFLGSHLLARLLTEPQPAEITLLKRSFSNISRISHLLPAVRTFDLDHGPIEEVFAGRCYDVVLHCATNYGRGRVPRSDIIEANLVLPLRLLDLSAERGTRIFINTDTMLDKNVSDYTLSKQQFREWLRGTSTNMACINMVLEHFYGAGDDRTKFVSSLIAALLEGKTSLALTQGMQTRDFIYIDDVTEAFLQVLHATGPASGYMEYQVGSGHPTRLRDFVELAKNLCGNNTTELRFGALPYRPNEPMSVVADVSRLRALGWKCRWNLQEGLRKAIEMERDAVMNCPTPLAQFPESGAKGATCGI